MNQVGYLTTDPKEAIVFSNDDLRMKKPLIVNQKNQIVFKGQLIPGNKTGFAPFNHHYTFDFSALKTPGEYAIKIEDANAKIKIYDLAYHGLSDSLLIFMRQQRCGYNPFFEQECHSLDGRVMGGGLPDSAMIDVRGGWHDAGDQLKYLITASNATARMMIAYQYNPSIFKDHFDANGKLEPNRLPDILDEAKWGLEWIRRLHSMTGILIHQVGDDRDHVGWKIPSEDTSNYGWGKNKFRVAYVATGTPQGVGKYKSIATGIANLAGRSAAALAIGNQVWKSTGLSNAYADTCLQAAIELYAMAKAKPGYQQGNSYGAPYRYNEDTWTDDLEWAATELFRCTHKKEYLKEAIHYARLSNTQSWIQKDTSAHYQLYPFFNIAHHRLFSLVNARVKKELISYYKKGIEQTISQRASKNIYREGVPFIWCSNNLMTDLILQIFAYEQMTNDRQFHAYMTCMRDWLFGRNPWGTSMFMNIGFTYPHDVHTSTWKLTGIEIPGGLVDGPIYYSTYQKQIGLTLTHDDAFAPFQNNYVVYHDDIGDYSTNEPTMDGTACAVMMMAIWER